MKKQLPFITLLVFGMIVLLSYFFPTLGVGKVTLESAAGEINSWVLIVTAWLEGLAAVNIFMHNAKKGMREKSRAPEAFLLCIGMVVMTGLTLGNRFAPDSWMHTSYLNTYEYFVQSAGNAIFALLAFYVASASYRAFRARSVESTLMLFAAVLVMIGASPLGEAVWPGFGTIKDWLTSVPNVASTRALLICASVGAISTSMKTLLGIERSALGDVSHGRG